MEYLEMLILHVPHSSMAIPANIREQFLLSDADLRDELLRMTDSYTEELFALPETMALAVTFPVSRLVCDPERFEDEASEVMARRGMGFVYTVTSDLRPLRRPMRAGEREQLLARYYRPHHRRLASAVARVLAAEGSCLVIDAHSFPAVPLPYEDDQAVDRPAICLGTDDFHTPLRLREAAREGFAASFDTVALNRPFSGALVPSAFYRRDPRVQSIMIEVNRSLYMDETSGDKLERFAAVAAAIRAALAQLHIVSRRGSG